MKAIRMIKEADQNGFLHIQVPPDMGKFFELIVLPLDSEQESEKMNYAAIQEQGGFVKEVLGSASEDVWNEI